MRKYFHIYKAELMSALQYIGNILFSFLNFFIIVFIILHLLNYLYDDPSEIINGYTKVQMIWYVILTEILWKIFNGRKFCRKICDDVRGGNIAYNMNKPFSYVGYILSSHLGEGTITGIAFMIFGFLIGYIYLGVFPNITIAGFVLLLISIMLAVLIDSFIIIFIGMVSFYIEDANPLYWIYSKLILVLGTLFPIEFFPASLQKIIAFSPIYVVSYGPAKLFVDFSYSGAVSIIISQIIYLIFTYAICTLLYKKGVKKLNVNGG